MNMFHDNPLQRLHDIITAADCHQLQAVYAGIGSRRTPSDVIAFMTRIAKRLDAWGWTLRSGGADGADTAFAQGADHKEVYVPWPEFTEDGVSRLSKPTFRAMEIAAKYHPNWKNLSDAVQKLHGRNVHQILGASCDAPCAMVICWTPDGSTGKTTAHTGGTGQAIRIAHDRRIPIFNLALPDHRLAWEEVIR
jgi:hypothetical protein